MNTENRIWNLELNDEDRHTLMRSITKINQDLKFTELEKELFIDFAIQLSSQH